MSSQAPARRFPVKLALIVPFLLLGLAGAIEAFSSPLDWSSAAGQSASGQQYDVPRWAASLNPLIIAIPALATAIFGVKAVMNRTRQLFSLVPVLLGVGSFAILVYVLFLIALANQQPDEVYSYSFVGIEGGVGTEVSLAVTILGTLVLGGCAAGSALVYLSGITPEGSGRFDKRPDEPDAMAQIIASSHTGTSLRR
jgi:hypothetical protein